MVVTVVNVIPATLSNEIQRDSEPNLAVNPADPTRIAASAFTPDPAASGNGPIFVSTDGGNTWALNVVLPGGNRTGDVTIRFPNASGILYSGILRFDNGDLNILRKANFTAAGLMTVLVDRANDDQPYVEAATVLGGAGSGSDRVYVPSNDTSQRPTGNTASIDQSFNAASAGPPAGFGTPPRLDPRATAALPSPPGGSQDGPSVRVAIHPQGRIYAVYFGWRTFASPTNTTDVVVVRDDNWGMGVTPYSAITDPSDTNAGVLVATGRSVPALSTLLGTQRIGSQIAIAVDPTNANIVYVAWADGTTAAGYTVRVRRSLMGGASGSWSGDLRTVSPATNPALAINSRGRVGLLYQKLVSPGGVNQWETHLETTDNAFTSKIDTILARVPDANGTYGGTNPIGDYASLLAVGKDFYGIFSANNTPNNANFPNGVSYQRFANFGTNQLFADAALTVPVGVSIDPFFFHVSALGPGDDFYVRDWTDSPTSGDTGVEPSTHPVFYATSDVWNRRGTLPGSFPNDQPENEDAGNGLLDVGDNWAFARIRRNQTAAASQTVTAHFLVSKLGTGSNYVDAGSADPDVTFPDPDPTVTFNAADLGPFVTTPYHWHLAPVSSTHLCLAVEITGPNDPIVPPSLVGRAPGWPTTDLAVINDNNKAQRNMGLSTTPARGVGLSETFYAIVHNAATFRRDMEIGVRIPPEILRRLKKPRLEIVGGRAKPLGPETSIVLSNMEPGENRWVGLTLVPPRGRPGEIVGADFVEIVDGTAINGFGIGARLAPTAEVIRSTLELHRSLFTRIAAGRKDDVAEEEVFHVSRLLKERRITPRSYVEYLQDSLPGTRLVLAALRKGHDLGDPFAIARARAELARRAERAQARVVDNLLVAHIDLLNRLDSFLTMLELEPGDPADILQNVRWQRDLYADMPFLRELGCSREVLKYSDDFIRGFERRASTNADFPDLIRRLLRCFEETARAAGRPRLRLSDEVRAIEDAGDELAGLQRAHRGFLLKLSTLA
ncbi:MAG: hypothetical protein E6G08_11635 [Actinobacteria bacterium]|nr:MAG: hypothetical protein E6G08_11635 [Actinomycetota bacterium]